MSVPQAQQPPTIDQLIAKYCVTADPPRTAGIRPADTAPLPRTPTTMGGHRVVPLIDGPAYFSALDDEIDELSASTAPRRFFYMASWLMALTHGQPITLRMNNDWEVTFDATGFVMPKSKRGLLVRLVELADSGVDVRVLPWISPFIDRKEVALGTPAGSTNLLSLLSVKDLRALLKNKQAVALNMLAHSLGGAHAKLVICGDQSNIRAYTSGLDPYYTRLTPPSKNGGWHDVGVMVEGRAAAAIHDFFCDMWNEQLERSPESFNINGTDIYSHETSWGPLVLRNPVAPRASGPNNTPLPAPQQYVQVLRTVPEMNFNQSGPQRRGELLLPHRSKQVQYAVGVYANRRFRRPPIAFANKGSGLFEFKLALKKAIDNAERYIFIADQSMYSQEVMDWINGRMQVKRQLKVILLYGADPDDPPSAFLTEAITKHLVDIKKIDPLNICFARWNNTTVHSKVAIVDDVWCAVGSANCMRRSLYTDIELSVCVIEAPTADAMLPAHAIEEMDPAKYHKAAPSFVQRFRRDLWAHYCGIGTPAAPAQLTQLQRNQRAILLNLDDALGIWRPFWRTSAAVKQWPQLRDEIEVLSVTPFTPIVNLPYHQLDYDRGDPDSRQPF